MVRKREKESRAGLVAGFVFRNETGIFVQVEISRAANRILLSLNDDTHPIIADYKRTLKEFAVGVSTIGSMKRAIREEGCS